MSFAPCSSCGRHIKTTEAACPFCTQGAPLSATPGLTGRASRAAIYAFTTTLALAGCTSGSPTSSTSSSGASSGTSGTSSGSSGASSSGSSSGESSSGAVAPPYGIAPTDAGESSSSSSSSTSSGASLYGAPPPDAGK